MSSSNGGGSYLRLELELFAQVTAKEWLGVLLQHGQRTRKARARCGKLFLFEKHFIT